MDGPQRIPVLVVEDEEPIRRGLCDVLAFHGYAPTGVASGDEGLEEGLRARHALVVLDLMLPGRSGFEVCEALRKALPSLPILILTARGSEADVLRGFRSGADDYVTKPFSLAELLARVEALLRRAGCRTELPAAPFAVGDWEVDAAGRTARRNGAAVDLSRLEVALLALLARERGRIVSRRRLLREVWGFERPERIETRTVDVHVAKLRRKLGDARAAIETVRGEGYRLAGR